MTNITIPTIVYQGQAQIYLQGQNALLATPPETADEMRYFIGGEQTNLVIRDFRPKVILEAHEAIRRQYQNGFAKVFSQRAYVEVRYDSEKESMEIQLYDSDNQGSRVPTLWAGVLENNTMPGYQVDWEIFKKVSKEQTAFVAMLT